MFFDKYDIFYQLYVHIQTLRIIVAYSKIIFIHVINILKIMIFRLNFHTCIYVLFKLYVHAKMLLSLNTPICVDLRNVSQRYLYTGLYTF